MGNILMLTTASFVLALAAFFIIVYVGGIIAAYVIKQPRYTGTGKSGLRGKVTAIPVTVAIYVFVAVFGISLYLLYGVFIP